jgi:hypothetical protein
MSNIHTICAMRALPVALAGGVVAGVRDGNVPQPKRSCDFRTARIAFT